MITDTSSLRGPRRRVKGKGSRIHAARLVMRPGPLDDAVAALAVYGAGDVARWPTPAMARAPDRTAIEGVLRQWMGECSALEPPAERWAIELAETGELVGGAAVLPLPRTASNWRSADNSRAPSGARA